MAATTIAPTTMTPNAAQASTWKVKMADTKLTGSRVNGGTPLSVTLKLDLGGNEWIVGLVDGGSLKMSKIKITGSTTFDWIGTRYDSSYNSSCGQLATFTVACFKGTDPSANFYPVDLQAEQAMIMPTNYHVWSKELDP